MNEKREFNSRLTRRELWMGLALIPIHAAVVPNTVTMFQAPLGLSASEASLATYVISFFIVVVVLNSFLKAEFSSLVDNPGGTVLAIVLAYLLFTVLNQVLALALSLIPTDVENPNNDAVVEQIKLNAKSMLAAAVLLAPVVEETLFRGVVFGSLRKHSRPLAYAVSFLVFAAYHEWSYAVAGFDWTQLLAMLEYLPASIALAWAYERSGNLWSPIAVHALINLITVQYYINN